MHPERVVSIFMLAIATLALAGCSDGGGGGGGNQAPNVSYYVDQPNFRNDGDSEGRVNVLAGSPVSLDASATYDPDGDALSYSWSFGTVPADSALQDGDISDANSQRATFTPDVIGNYEIDLAVNDGKNTSRVTVLLNARAYTTATNIEAVAGDAERPAVAVADGENANGDAVVVWAQPDADYLWAVYGNHYDASADSWSGASLIAHTSRKAESPDVGVDKNGNAVAVWIDSGDLYTARYTASSDTWSTTGAAHDDGGDEISEARVAVAESGEAALVWHRCIGSSSDQIMADYAETPGTWDSPSWDGLTQLWGHYQLGSPRVGIDGQGNAIFLGKYVSGYREVRAQRYDGSTWTPDGNIRGSTTDQFMYDLQIGVGEGGNAVALWNERREDDETGTLKQEVRAVPYTSSGNWGSLQTVSEDFDWVVDPSLGVDKDGNAIVAWARSEQAVLSGFYTSRLNFSTDTWSPATEVTDDGISNPELAMDTDGDAVLVWEDGFNIVASRYEQSSGSWGEPARIESGMGDVRDPVLGIAGNAEGHAMAVWQQEEGANGPLGLFASPFDGIERSWD
jgi:hypothetical protein